MAYEDYRKEMNEITKTACDSVERLTNGGGDEYRKTFVGRLCSMHRTLQQKFIGEVVIPIVRNMANKLSNGDVDPRNEYACKVCKAMLNGIAKEFPYIANGECNLPLI